MAAAYVNTGSGFNTASGGSIATGATSHTAGNLLVCCVRHEGASTTISLADTAGNTWTPLTKVTHPGGDMYLQLFYALNCAGNASNVVTATFGASRTFRGIQVQQFSGLSSYDEEDSGTTSAGTSVTAGTVNIDGAGVVVNGIAIYGGLVTWSASTGYTLVQNASDTQRMGMSYELETGSSAESPGASGSSNDDWIIVSAAFLESGDATATTLSGPTVGMAGLDSSNFTVGANGAITGTVTVTPSDSSGGGTFTPSTVDISNGSPTGTFTYKNNTPGSYTISTTNNGGLSNPSSIVLAVGVNLVSQVLTTGLRYS